MIFIIYDLLGKYYGLFDFSLENRKDYIVVHKNDMTFFLYNVVSKEVFDKYYSLSFLVDYVDPFVFNCMGEIVTVVDNNYYVLVFHLSKRDFPISVFSFYKVEKTIRLRWLDLWIQKSDYMNSFYPSIKGIYSLIDESIHYYMGLLEYSIFILKDYRDFSSVGYVQHENFVLEEYCNPFNLLIDVRERDFSEYLKYLFFSNTYQKVDIVSLIQQARWVLQFDLVIARLLFPNYYFCIVDDII